MEGNSEEENYSLLDEKRKEEIILQLKNEINEQIINNSKTSDEKNDIDMTSENKEIFNQINFQEINQINTNITNLNYDSNSIFHEINNFIKDKDIVNNNQAENKEYEKTTFTQLKKDDSKNQNKEKEFQEQNEDIKNKYLDKINNKKNLLFNKENKIPKLKSNKSFHETKKVSIKNSKLNKNINPTPKSKSTGKLKINHKTKNTKSTKHKIIPNEKSKEKFKNMQIEINNKFKEEHPFKPKINSNKNNKLKETNEERLTRLSRPKILEIKGIHMIKTEESKLQDNENINKKKSYNKIKANQVSNRLYKLHQQIQEKKEQVKKIFEKKEMDKCSFNPEINTTSKKIMNKTFNNLSFNE